MIETDIRRIMLDAPNPFADRFDVPPPEAFKARSINALCQRNFPTAQGDPNFR
jgi:hypothetical protein